MFHNGGLEDRDALVKAQVELSIHGNISMGESDRMTLRDFKLAQEIVIETLKAQNGTKRQ